MTGTEGLKPPVFRFQDDGAASRCRGPWKKSDVRPVRLMANNAFFSDDPSDHRAVFLRRAQTVPAEIFQLSRRPGGRLWSRDVERQLAIAVGKGRGVDFFELDIAVDHAGLPGVVLAVVLKLRHHFAAEQIQGFADVLMGVLAGLIEQDDLVDVRGAEPPQLFADGFRRADQPATKRGFLRFRILALPLLYSSHMLTIPGAGRWRSCEAP